MGAIAASTIDTQVEENAYPRVEFRQNVLAIQAELQRMVDASLVEAGDYPVTHYFTPRDETHGCYVYAREIFLPKGHIIIGKIHKQAHLAFLLKGKISVVTESGTHYFEAPYTFISEAGVKRIAYVEEDTIWTTVHVTAQAGEEHVAEIEEEIIANTYGELGLISSLHALTGEGVYT